MVDETETSESGDPDLAEEEVAALDSLYSLPLKLMPLEHPGVRKASLIKNAQLETVIELYSGIGVGSGQVDVEDLSEFFSDNDGMLSRDMRILSQLEPLNSFDVFTLRIELRKLEIGFDQYDALKLSGQKREELSKHMQSFTRPLMQRVFGDHASDDMDVSKIIARIASPDRTDAIEKLNKIAEEMAIRLDEIPRFLENYGDVFLSLSYFKDCLRWITEMMNNFRPWIQGAWKEQSNQRSPEDTAILKATENLIDKLIQDIQNKFNYFDRKAESFWDNTQDASFSEFRELVFQSHVGIAAVLCGLTVKFERWLEVFPSADGGGMAKRIEFIKTDFRSNMDRLLRVPQFTLP